MQLHHHAGRHDDAAATYTHLRAVLDDINTKPEPHTRALAAQIQRAQAAETER